MDARVAAIEEQLTLLQAGMEARVDQRFLELQQVTENVLATRFENMGEMLE